MDLFGTHHLRSERFWNTLHWSSDITSKNYVIIALLLMPGCSDHVSDSWNNFSRSIQDVSGSFWSNMRFSRELYFTLLLTPSSAPLFFKRNPHEIHDFIYHHRNALCIDILVSMVWSIKTNKITHKNYISKYIKKRDMLRFFMLILACLLWVFIL